MPATLPFDATYQGNGCSSSFTGRFLGYSKPQRQQATYSVTRQFAFAGDVFTHSYSGERTLSLLPTGIGSALDQLLGEMSSSDTTHLLEAGDSGGPLFEGATLCGINSGWGLPSFGCSKVEVCDPLTGSCVPICVPGTDVCVYKCEVTVSNRHARVDRQGGLNELIKMLPPIFDARDNLFGTCGPSSSPLADVDNDRDFIPDACDPCPYVPDPSYRFDGKLTFEQDLDKDGVPDLCDSCPTVKNPRDPLTWQQADSDLDGVGDACDKCPYSDVRGESDFACCNTDADCYPGNPAVNPKTNLCRPIAASVVNGLTLPNPCAGFAGRCSLGKDFDADGYADSCDNCRTQSNWNQADDDEDGAGNVCDNCAGVKDDLGPYPDEDHSADKNNVFALMCTSDAQCVAKTGIATAECSPARLIPTADGGVELGGRSCNKFKDDDGDGLGNACDSCPGVANAPTDLGGVNNQANCNLDIEIARGEPYPYVGDACDPNPCTRTFEKAVIMTTTAQDLWLTLSLEPQVLPNSVKVEKPSSQAAFDPKYTGTPDATVGARFCPCKVEGKLVGTVKDCELQCPLNAGHYTQSTAWLVPSMAQAPANYSLPASPPPGYLTPGAEFAGLLTEEPQLGLAVPTDKLASHGTAPTLVSWDLGTGSAPGFGLNVGKLGVLWTAVRDVPQMSPASPPVFRSHSNHYDSNFYGKTFDLSVQGAALASCFWCQIDPCPHCATSMDIQNLLIDPTQPVVGAKGLTQSTDLTASFSSAAITALLEPDVRWLQAAERGSWMRRGRVGLVALAPDGTRVRAALAQVGGLVQPVGRSISDDGALALAEEPPASGPASRSDFAGVLSGRENAVFVLGGKLTAEGTQPGDVWRYGLESRQWTRVPVVGPTPRLVLAATYQPETRSIWLVDADTGPGVARVIRLDLDSLQARIVGLYPRAGQSTRVDLSNAPSGELLLTGSSAKLNRVAAVVLRPGKHHLFAVGGLFHTGQLALEPTLTRRGLTLPLSQPAGAVQNGFVAADDVYHAPKKQGAGPKPTVSDCL